MTRRMLALSRLLGGFFIAAMLASAAHAQTGGVKTQSALAAEMESCVNQSLGAGCITPQQLQDLIVSSALGVNNAVAAAGTGQGSATALSQAKQASKVTSGTGGVLLPTAVAGQPAVVCNASGASISLYPATGASINGGAANAPITLTNGTCAALYAMSATDWEQVSGGSGGSSAFGSLTDGTNSSAAMVLGTGATMNFGSGTFEAGGNAMTFPGAAKTLAANDWSNMGSMPTSGDLMLSAGNDAAPTAYAGTSCTNQTLTALSAAGGGTCNSITSAYISGSITAAQMLALATGDVYQGNGSNQPAAVTLSAAIDAAIGSTRGSILERGSAGWALLGPGSNSGYVLTSNGTGADPSYQASAGSSTTVNLAPGLGSSQTTFNGTGSAQSVTNSSTLYPQAASVAKTGAYTLNADCSSGALALCDTARLILADGSASIAITAPNPAGTLAPYQIADEAGHGFTVPTVGGTATFVGCVTGSPTTLTVPANYAVQLFDQGSGANTYFCTFQPNIGVGTSGAVFGLLNSNNTYGGNDTFSGANSHTGTETFASVEGGDNVQSGTTYTTAATDCGKTLLFTSNSAVTVTIAASIAPASGTSCLIGVIQGGTAKVSVNGSAVSAASLISAHSYTGTSGTQGSVIGLHVTTVSSTATAYLTGDGS